MIARFEIPEPVGGDYTIIVRGAYGRETVEGGVTLTVELPA